MADIGWTARMATAAGTAAGTGAAQLGLGYGLGVVVWPVVATSDDSDWLGSLGWATWIAASATVFGAVIASRLGGGPAGRPRGPWRWGLAISAGVGALVAVALIALPAREASVREDAFTPQAVATGYALVGVLLGVLVAYWAVRSRPVAANLIFTSAWLWALAITAIAVELTTDRGSATYLTSLQFSEAASGGRYGTIYWPSALLTLAAAFAIGILAAIPAARRGELTLGTATSGAVGPLLVAASFLILSPRLTGAVGPLQSAYLIAPYAVLAGLAGSAITVALAQAQATRRARRHQPTDATTVPAADLATTAQIPATPRSTSPTGRAKLPAQPTPGSAPDASDPSSRPTSPTPAGGPSPRPNDRSAPPASGRPTPTPADRSTPPASDRPTPTPADRFAANPADRSTPTTPPDRSTPITSSDGGTHPAADRGTHPAADRGAPSAASRGPDSATPTGRASAVGAGASAPSANPPKSPSSTSRANDFADAEIAEAARPARGRAKKAPSPQPTTGAKEPKSTVTPPPPTPRIAQINPKPPEDE